MPRAIWSGAISFGLVTVPVKLFPATSPKDIRFNQLHEKDHGRINMKRWCAKEQAEVAYEEIVKGYEIAPEQYVVIKPEELEALDPEASRSIDILDFVPLAQIDPVFFENAYYLVPDKVGEKAYALLLAAMNDSERVAIARMVMRGKQYLAAIRPTEKALALSTLLFGDEVVPVADVEGLPKGLPKVDKRELTMASQLIETLAADFEPSKYKDEYRERVMELIRKRAKGETVTVREPSAKGGKVVDLAEALEQTLKMVREKKAKAEAKAPKRGAK
ncbi:MAG TPA: Ku protein [Candidatus Thermoplasmatota archaeon]|jgi:DNA end-binding protein Ku|nr:Ku protein [Candidatus Thermoplasmatota archaeon]